MSELLLQAIASRDAIIADYEFHEGRIEELNLRHALYHDFIDFLYYGNASVSECIGPHSHDLHSFERQLLEAYGKAHNIDFGLPSETGPQSELRTPPSAQYPYDETGEAGQLTPAAIAAAAENPLIRPGHWPG